MERSFFAPADFIITDKLRSWAKTTFNINDKEVDRQTEIWHLHEYQRAYSDWKRAWQRWFYQADKYDLLKREFQPRTVEVLSEKEREADIIKFDKDMRKYRK